MNNHATHTYSKINHLLIKFSGINTVIDIAELHGFLTGLSSSPHPIHEGIWQQYIVDHCYCEMESTLSEFALETDELLEITHGILSHIQSLLKHRPDRFEPILYGFNSYGKKLLNAEDWCIGYMKAVPLWQLQHPTAMIQENLNVIALHGLAENHTKLDNLPFHQNQTSITKITQAVLNIYHVFYPSEI